MLPTLENPLLDGKGRGEGERKADCCPSLNPTDSVPLHISRRPIRTKLRRIERREEESRLGRLGRMEGGSGGTPKYIR